ncbi:MAG: hypothetical protein JSW06_07455 [Thermoplasmatales archaeon]|nr:MAG: hypothetical protein JSW06_07455 [Thermoplasmatales archaeon]
MKGKKILATLVVLAMLLATMVVLKEMDVKFEASAIPGYDWWGYPTNTTTSGLMYSTSPQDVVINTTGLTQGNSYYLYFPKYSGYYGTSYNLTWKRYTGVGNNYITVATVGVEETFSGVVLNRSGLWVVAGVSAVPNASDAATFASTIDKHFWVNTSSVFSLSASPDEVYYGLNETIGFNVTHEGSGTDSIVDIRRESTEDPITSGIKRTGGDGEVTLSTNWQNRLTAAGNYTVVAYWDIDGPTQNLYDIYGYNYTHGWSKSNNGNIDPANTSADYYNYALCGPWDPPEHNSTYLSPAIWVHSGVPTTSIPTANETMYWSFDGEVNISVHNYDGTNISTLSVKVFNSDDVDVTANLTVNSATAYRGYIKISNNTWGVDQDQHTFGTNGTWYAYIFSDLDGDGDATNREWTEEWNTTVEFQVSSAPGVQFKWVDDGSGDLGETGERRTDGVIPRIPSLAEQPIDIRFQIIGDDHTYYGDEASSDAAAPYEKGENITISGDSLFLSSKTLDKLDGVSYSSGIWTVPITPTMALNGGEITISSSWSDYGSLTETLHIGGESVNGTIVTISPNVFIIDKNLTITVTVTDSINAGYGYTNAQVWLRWVGEDNRTLFGSSDGILSYKNGGGSTAGEYTFFVNKSMQTTNQTAVYGSIMAPRNISAYVALYRGGTTGSTPEGYVYGYALAEMKPISDLKVTAEAAASASTSTLMAGKKYSKMWFNTTTVDATGNLTGYPADSGLKVRIYNDTGVDVTADIGSLTTSDTDGKANKTATNEFLQKPGTYTVHAYNNTHNSEGNNATLIVQPVDVTSTISEFIWNVDKNISATFTIKYNEELLNGTLRIDNMTAIGTSYNKTWTNCSFAPSIGSTGGSDTAGNVSKQISITNGVVTINNITANFLPGTASRENITMYFKPKSGAWARTSGIFPVKIADVTASPSSIAYNEPTELEVTVTGRGAGLGNVFVSIMIPGLTGEMNTTTLADGTATFAFTPPTTGEITIAIENRTSDTKVPVTSWKLYIDVPSAAGENVDFTVTIRNGTATGAAVADAAVTFNRETKTTDASGQVTFTAPAVVTFREFSISASKEGHAEGITTIMILNIPKLIIVVQGEVSAGSTFDVIIADDVGNAVVGATITINNNIFTTGANGIATVTAPSEEGTYTISATFPGYTDADPLTIEIEAGGIPGFELLTLIAAIGVAFILLRRRRK